MGKWMEHPNPCAPHVVPEIKVGRAMLVAYVTNRGWGRAVS